MKRGREKVEIEAVKACGEAKQRRRDTEKIYREAEKQSECSRRRNETREGAMSTVSD